MCEPRHTRLKNPPRLPKAGPLGCGMRESYRFGMWTQAAATTAGETDTAQPRAVLSRASTLQTTPGSVRRLAAAECEQPMTADGATAAPGLIEPDPRVWKASGRQIEAAVFNFPFWPLEIPTSPAAPHP